MSSIIIELPDSTITLSNWYQNIGSGWTRSGGAPDYTAVSVFQEKNTVKICWYGKIENIGKIYDHFYHSKPLGNVYDVQDRVDNFLNCLIPRIFKVKAFL